MFSMPGPMELVVILFVVIFLFGAKRLPDLGASLGKGISNFKRSLAGDADADAKKPVKKE